MLLFNEAPSDIKYKLSHRASFILGVSGLDPIEAFEKLKEFYNSRSKLVHGGGELKYDPDTYLVSRYTRKCLITFLVLLRNPKRRDLGAKKRKSRVLQEIDYAMLDERKRLSLTREIQRGLNRAPSGHVRSLYLDSPASCDSAFSISSVIHL